MRTAALVGSVLLMWAPAAAAAEPAGEPGAARMVVQAVAGLVGVVGLVVLTRYLLLRLGPGSGTASVRLREVVRLSPQHALYVVEVEGRRLLLGQHVHLVCELGPSPAGEEGAGLSWRVREAVSRFPRLRGEGRR